jgi:hypothetical protein
MRVRVLFSYLTAVWSLAPCIAQCGTSATGETGISPEELFSRIHRTSAAEFRNGVGYYVVRTFDNEREAKKRKTIESLERSLEESLNARIENDKKFGIATDVEKLRAENQAALAEAKVKYQGQTTTRVERYVVQGSNYRIERVAVSNTDSLEKVVQDVIAGRVDVSKPAVIAWNGSVTAEIFQSMASNGKESESFSSVSYKRLANSPDFMSFGRDASDGDFLAKCAKCKWPLSTESVMVGGEPGIVFRIGNKRTDGFLMEAIALPEKEYAIASTIVKAGGAVVNEDEYSEFVKASNGNWLPMRIVRSRYSATKQGVPVLAWKRELLAIEPPKVNVELPADVFDLANTREFQSLRSVSITKKEGSPEPDAGAPGTSGIRLAIRICACAMVIMLAVVGFVFRRRRRPSAGRGKQCAALGEPSGTLQG